MTHQQNNKSQQIESRSLLKSSCDLESLLMGDIRTLLSNQFDSQTKSSILVLLDQLILNLPVLLELSSKNGYLNVVLEKRPGWARQIDALYQANLDCISSLKLVRNCLKNDRNFDALSQELGVPLQNWIESFSAMRCLESTILQEAFTIDLGGEA